MEGETQPQSDDDRSPPRPTPSRAAWTLAIVLVAFGVGAAAYRGLHLAGLSQTSAFFIGLPALMAALAAFLTVAVRASSFAGIVFKTITVGLLASAIVLGEGFVCILFAAPLFYLVGTIIVVLFALGRSLLHRGTTTALGLALLPALLLSTEGVAPGIDFPHQAVSYAERIVNASADEVEAALGSAPHFGAAAELPPFLRLGFPHPVEASGKGLEPGDLRTIGFASPSGRVRRLVLQVDARGSTWVRFRRTTDETKIAEWLDWQTAEVGWTALSPHSTLVRWTITYERRLDPAWYFAPLESLATTGAAEYLIDAAASPARTS